MKTNDFEYVLSENETNTFQAERTEIYQTETQYLLAQTEKYMSQAGNPKTVCTLLHRMTAVWSNEVDEGEHGACEILALSGKETNIY